MQTGRLTIRRPGQYADKARTYRIFVDGAPAGTIKSGDELTLDLTVGEHVIQARIDWCRSNALKLSVRSGTPIELEVGSNALKAGGLSAIYYVTFGYSKYLYLRSTERTA
jgi:hypothetical protein